MYPEFHSQLSSNDHTKYPLTSHSSFLQSECGNISNSRIFVNLCKVKNFTLWQLISLRGGFPYMSLTYTASFLIPHGTMCSQLDPACFKYGKQQHETTECYELQYTVRPMTSPSYRTNVPEVSTFLELVSLCHSLGSIPHEAH